MKVLVIGGYGSIGRRYCAILKYRNIKHQVYDTADYDGDFVWPPPFHYDRAIIATPTHTHFEICEKLMADKTPFLCEKPVSKDIDECKRLWRLSKKHPKLGRVVCNYKYLLKLMDIKTVYDLQYNYYNSGPDGILWDCCQLIHILKDVVIKNDSPRWNLIINNHWARYRWLENSYVEMLDDWLGGHEDRLWDLEDGYQMTKKVWARDGLLHSDTSQKHL